ncbi:MAG TPA: hypothetical protein VEF35_07855 [Candidatus Bathyarchaeia archaeon]|nr:hypothetical protein [Candidatus Bathyarchaeia archaeon]
MQEHSFEHSGSVDIDLALRKDVLRQMPSVNIREIFESLGYQSRTDSKFYRDLLPSSRGEIDAIRVDLLCDREGENCSLGIARPITDGIQAHAFDGMSIAFDCNRDRRIQFELDGTPQETTFKVIDLAGLLALKANSFVNRPFVSEDYQEKRSKDAYDIYALTHYGDDSRQAAEYFIQSISNVSPGNLRFLAQSVGYLNTHFRETDQDGPKYVDYYMEDDSTDYKPRVVGQLTEFLDHLDPIVL